VSVLLQLDIFTNGNRFFGIDAFGWGVILFVLLLFGIPYSRYFLRAADLKDWPIVTATVRNVEIISGFPRELVPPIAAAVANIPTLIPYHCRTLYVFLVDGTLYQGSFELCALNLAEAERLAEALKGQPVLVKYNPHRPADSELEEKDLLGKKVVQEDNQPLNPKVW
jgi:hypothetical protein